ncbi:MAG: LysR family transcriptional regulator [Oceanococcaceae bacterium]
MRSDHVPFMLSFAAVVEAGSFVGAARKLDLAPSAVSKQVAKLEQALGAKLLHRTTRRIALTEAGTAVLGHCQRIQDELQQSEQALASLQEEPQGKLRITTMSSVCTTLLSRMIPAFHARYPRISLEVVASDHIVDLIEEGYDLALRVTSRPADNLVARELTPIQFLLCAAPSYLEAHGAPQSLEDLAQHRCLSYPASRPGYWDFWSEGQHQAVPIQSPLSINSVDTVRSLVLQGFGLALLPNYAVAEPLRAGKLVHLLPGYHGIAEARLYAVHLPNRYGSPKVRAFVDFCLEFLRAEMPKSRPPAQAPQSP